MFLKSSTEAALPLIRWAAALALGVATLQGAAAQQAMSYQAADLSRATRQTNAQLADPALEKRVNDLLQQMTLEEKLGQLVQYNDLGVTGQALAAGEAANAPGRNPAADAKVDALALAATGRVGSMLNTVGAAHTAEFQRVAVEKSRLHIPLLFGADIIHGYRTIYPVPLGLAATFDPEMVEKLCHLSASEARTAGINWFYSPMVDISRDPRWGRTLEGAGEDPYLGAAIARAYISGYQGKDLAQPDRVAASIKHFAAYGEAEAGREYNTTDMSLSRLQQFYLPPYKAAVEEGAATVMSAFNALNGVPASANHFLLQDVLRDSWGFNGMVVSDYTAIMELRNHGIAKDAAEAAVKSLRSGVDVDMMSHYYDVELPAQIAAGKISIAEIDEAVRRVLRVKFALGLFENPYAVGSEVTHAVDRDRPLVRQAAEESIVLLKNDAVGAAPVLPLKAAKQRIALIGPLADDSQEMINIWGNPHRQPDTVTLKMALEERMKALGGELVTAAGSSILGNSESGFAEAVAAARHADVVVMALGESGELSGEAGSRAHLDLPGNQQKLLEAVAATGKPVVLVLFSGRPLELGWADQHVPAILAAWFPGTEAGHALTNLLFGDVAPSGKLPMSFPRTVGQEPMSYNQFPTGRPATHADLNKLGAGDERFISRYVDVPNSPLYPFGWGLSYTRFNYASVELSRAVLPLDEAHSATNKPLITASTTVTNTGTREATETVQCYLTVRGASLEQPVQSLKGFRRIHLKPGESQRVSFELGFDELSYYDNAGRAILEATEDTVRIGGSSLATDQASFQIQ